MLEKKKLSLPFLFYREMLLETVHKYGNAHIIIEKHVVGVFRFDGTFSYSFLRFDTLDDSVKAWMK